jgi:organic hydroperoxide reductase OsmC/OhrA
MADKTHRYTMAVIWTGNEGTGTSGYRTYRRDHDILADGKATIAGSSDPAFRGDPKRWNPEELLVASLSTCHMLWFLHLASDAGLAVTGYEDAPVGTMVETADGGGQFAEVVLHPSVTVGAGDLSRADALHRAAHEKCFIARSVNFPVRCEATIRKA